MSLSRSTVCVATGIPNTPVSETLEGVGTMELGPASAPDTSILTGIFRDPAPPGGASTTLPVYTPGDKPAEFPEIWTSAAPLAVDAELGATLSQGAPGCAATVKVVFADPVAVTTRDSA